VYFGRDAGHPADGRDQAAPATRYRNGESQLDGDGHERNDGGDDGRDEEVQGTCETARSERRLLRRKSAARRHRHHAGRDVETGKAILPDYIKATVGFEKLGKATDTPAKSLMRITSPSGNRLVRNLFRVIGYVAKAGAHRAACDAGAAVRICARSTPTRSELLTTRGGLPAFASVIRAPGMPFSLNRDLRQLLAFKSEALERRPKAASVVTMWSPPELAKGLRSNRFEKYPYITTW
jgi:hypothetical protein